MTAIDEKELTFLDLVVLQRIGPDTTLERFGSKINSSFFDAANILGTIKLKGYVNIESSMGASKVDVSEAGKAVLSMAEDKSSGELDELDKNILQTISKGVKDTEKLASNINIRTGDLAYHLYKLVKNNYLDYDVRAGKVSVMLTENGFNKMGKVVETEEPEEGESLGEDIVGGKDAPRPNELKGGIDIDDVRRRSKMDYYMKKYGGHGIIAVIIVFIIIILIAAYLLL